eukprot:Platyproteum_vivax@DN8609_c0_g1_i1.p1
MSRKTTSKKEEEEDAAITFEISQQILTLQQDLFQVEEAGKKSKAISRNVKEHIRELNEIIKAETDKAAVLFSEMKLKFNEMQDDFQSRIDILTANLTSLQDISAKLSLEISDAKEDRVASIEEKKKQVAEIEWQQETAAKEFAAILDNMAGKLVAAIPVQHRLHSETDVITFTKDFHVCEQLNVN